MPIFYNTSSPTPSSKNTINEIAVGYGIRDFLLNLNLLPQYPQLSTNINGSPKIGQPVLDTTIGTGNILIPNGLPLETNGIIWKDLNIIHNDFQNQSSLSDDLKNIDYIPALSNPDFGDADWPNGSQYPTGSNDEVEQYGIKGKTNFSNYRIKNVTKNLYLDSSGQRDVADYIGLIPLDISNQLTNYVDVFGGLNEGGTTGDQTINIIGSVLNGQGVGIGNNNTVIPNFDFKASLASRVLSANGFIQDTKLGNVGAQQLALALANNAAFNVEQELLGTLNLKENIYSLIKDGEVAGFRPSYRITVPKSTGGQILNIGSRILGFTIPRSYLDDSGSIFQNENGDAGNIKRANSMIENTGKGQVKSLLKNITQNVFVNSINENPFRSGYAPGFNDKEGESLSTAKLYAYYLNTGEGTVNGDINKILGNIGDVIPSLSYLREALTELSGFESPENNGVGPVGNSGYDNRKISDVGFTWTSTNGDSLNNLNEENSNDGFELRGEIFGDKKSLLVKTQKLFNSRGMKNLVSVKGEMNTYSSQIQTANEGGISKGSGVLTKERYNLDTGTVNSTGSEADTHFCRSWTTLDRYDSVLHRYDSVQKLIRNKPLYSDPEAPYRFQTQGSVLDGPFVKIGPYRDGSPTDPKKFMFSIENLAWKDRVTELPPCEQGNGDLVSGDRGRIMWFPPYDIVFNENNSVNWEETNFIGRGEPLYTYNNTKRSGTLSFKVIVDHPSYFNAFKARAGQQGPDDNFIASYFAGCVDIDKKWSDKLTTSQIQGITQGNVENPQQKNNPTDPTPPKALSVYFPNDVKIYNPDYEDGKCGDGSDVDYTTNPVGYLCGLGEIQADVTQKDINGVTKTWPDRYDYGLNAGRNSTATYPTIVEGKNSFGFNDPNYSINMIEFLKKYKWAVVKVKGFASPQGNIDSNTTLANNRAELLKEKLKNEWGSQLGLSSDELNKRFVIGGSEVLSNVSGCLPKSAQNPEPPTDTIACKLARKAEISVYFDTNLKAEYDKSLQAAKSETISRNIDVTKEIRNKFYTECDYFEKLTESNKFVFDNIREKIRYFHPAFHSTTPEGLNSRLTFLLQCTRQGPTLETQNANNLAFGRPPVCILRIGDFYHTKIVIDNLNISYDPLVWDLNPEGVGVQPMIANVDITFNFIGGSSLMGPINKLQNALSFNYFANTQVYDPRADYISKNRPFITNLETSIDSDGGVVGELKNVQVPESENGYYINDGKPYSAFKPEERIIKEQINEVSNIELNQIKNEEAVNSGPTNQEQVISATGMDDMDVIGCFGFYDYLDFEVEEINKEDGSDFSKENLSLTFRLEFQAKVGIDEIALNKAQTAKFYLKNSGTKQKELLATFRLSPNDNKSIDFKVDDGTSGNSSQLLSFTGSNNKSRIIFQVDVNVDDNQTKVSLIRELYRKSGSSLQVEWDNTSGKAMFYGWNKTIGKPNFF